MTKLIFFLEEPSAKAMLQGFLPKILPKDVYPEFVVFEGKTDLEKRLGRKLKIWSGSDTRFVVMRDQDNGDCLTIKNNLVQKCIDSGKPETLVRIACRELESFYLGDLEAVAQTIGPKNLVQYQKKAKYRNPDQLTKPSNELKKLAHTYQKISGSRSIGRKLDPKNNRSKSFINLVQGVQKLTGSPV